MEHRVKVTVLDKKLFPELQTQYCAVPDSGKCPCYNVGDEFMFYRNDERDDYWHMGAGTLIKSGTPDEFYNLLVQCIAVQKEFLSAPKHGIALADTSILHFKGEQLCTAGLMTIKL